MTSVYDAKSSYNAEALAFAETFVQELRSGKYQKDCLPNQGIPMNIKYAQERAAIFEAMLDGVDTPHG